MKYLNKSELIFAIFIGGLVAFISMFNDIIASITLIGSVLIVISNRWKVK